MKKDRTGIIFLIIALIGFVLIKVVPLVYAPAPTHETGKIKVKSKTKSSVPTPFTKQGNAWFKNQRGNNIVVLDIEIADTDYKITKGLMDRPKMEMNQGMLFVFNDMDHRSFWMKNTVIPLDIIYITKNGSIDSFYQNTTPHSIKSLPSAGQAMYVLETNAGFMAKYGIDKNTKFDFNKL